MLLWAGMLCPDTPCSSFIQGLPRAGSCSPEEALCRWIPAWSCFICLFLRSLLMMSSVADSPIWNHNMQAAVGECRVLGFVGVLFSFYVWTPFFWPGGECMGRDVWAIRHGPEPWPCSKFWLWSSASPLPRTCSCRWAALCFRVGSAALNEVIKDKKAKSHQSCADLSWSTRY